MKTMLSMPRTISSAASVASDTRLWTLQSAAVGTRRAGGGGHVEREEQRRLGQQ